MSKRAFNYEVVGALASRRDLINSGRALAHSIRVFKQAITELADTALDLHTKGEMEPDDWVNFAKKIKQLMEKP